jgi:hypothetical protein
MVGAVQVHCQVLNTQPTGIDHCRRRRAIGKGTLPAQRLCLEPWVSGAFGPLSELATNRTRFVYAAPLFGQITPWRA